jgi:hypothetical protein
MKKKITVVFVLILMVLNFIFCNFSFAYDDVDKSELEKMTIVQDNDGKDVDLKELTKGITDDLTSGISLIGDEENAATTAGSTKKYDVKQYVKSSYGTAGGVLYSIWAFIIGGWLNNIPQLIVEATGSTVIDDQFTIYDLVIGNYEFFNFDYYGVENMGNVGDTKLVNTIFKNISTFYFTLRNLSLALSLFILMYVAIRMAIATTAVQKARFKHMLTGWFTSVVLLFFMHFIIIFMSYFVHIGLELVQKIAEAWEVTNIEGDIVKGNLQTLKAGGGGFHLFQTLVMVTAFIYYEIKFLIAYIKRFCEMAFLIIISPLVTVTYALDKIGDNRAQAFSTWFKELSTLYALQVVHATTYVIFIAAAGEIAQTIPFVAIFFLWAMGRAEKTIRKVVGLRGAEHVEKAEAPRPKLIPKFLTGRRGKG